MSYQDIPNDVFPSNPMIIVGSVPQSMPEILEPTIHEQPRTAIIQNGEHDLLESAAGHNLDPQSPVAQAPPLPPTPPSFQKSSNVPIQRNSVDSYASGFVTPTSARSPPTPDLTPPRFKKMLNKTSVGSVQGESSYAASFKSAQEDLVSLLSRDSGELVGPESSFRGSKLPEMTPVARVATPQDVFVGMNEPVSISRHSLKHKPEFHFSNGDSLEKPVPKLYANGSQASGSDLEDDTTPRYKQPLKAESGSTSTPPSLRGLGLHGQRSSPQANGNLKYEPLRGVTGSNTGSPNGSDPKRLSATSGSSTVVEAVVIDRTPPSHQRKLRHVSKTDSLRESASPQSNRFQEFGTSPSQQHHVLRRQKATIPPRPVTAPQEDTESAADREYPHNQRRIVSDPLQALSMEFDDITPPPPSASPASLATDTYYDAVPVLQLNDGLSDAGNANRLSMPGSFPSNSPEATERRSLTRSIAYSPQTLRQLYGASPTSAETEFTDNFEINEAHPVKLSAHTNDSLVLVNNSRSSDLLHSETADSQPTIATQPRDTIGIPTDGLVPYKKLQDEDITPHSPLKNPRAAPEPPSIAVITSTPAKVDPYISDEHKAETSDDNGVKPASIFMRARRYSETLMHPISGSLRRSRQRRSLRKSSKNIQAVSTQSDHLHPHWQPRHEVQNASQGGIDTTSVHPGVTSEAIDPQPGSLNSSTNSSNQRKGSIKGFLIGNTLGLERGPTNKRRPIINFPEPRIAKRQRQSSAPENLSLVTVRQSAKRSGTGRRVKKSRAKNVIHNWRERIRERRIKIQERSRERRRADLRNSIEGPFQQTTEPV